MIRNPCRFSDLCLSFQRECTSRVFKLFITSCYCSVHLISWNWSYLTPLFVLIQVFLLKLWRKKEKNEEKIIQAIIILQLIVDNISKDYSTS